jgi:hypothetical protein
MRAVGHEAPVTALAPLLAPERMVLRLTCAAPEDASSPNNCSPGSRNGGARLPGNLADPPGPRAC